METKIFRKNLNNAFFILKILYFPKKSGHRVKPLLSGYTISVFSTGMILS